MAETAERPGRCVAASRGQRSLAGWCGSTPPLQPTDYSRAPLAERLNAAGSIPWRWSNL